MTFYRFMRAVITPFYKLYFLFPKMIHREKMHAIDRGPAMIVCNHLTNYDPVVVGLTIKSREIIFMAKKMLWKNKIFGAFISALGAFPVDREAGNDLKSIKTALKTLKEGKVLGIFPEGQRNKSDEKLLPFMEGAGFIAHRTRPIVLPAAIKGRYGFLRRPTIEIGDPIDLSEEYAQKGDQQVYQAMVKKMEDAVRELVMK